MPADGRNKVKQKRRKKDLEELHRNVLEATKKMHRKTSRDTKWKTAFAKVLTKFADQRQQNEDTTHERNGRKANPRTICSRLLPEPIVGMYKNGAKGRQARRADGCMGGTLNARLEGNVLKLLNGDETNPNSSGNSEVKRTKQTEQACSKKTVESDSSILGKKNGDKWMNRGTRKNVAGQEDMVKARDQPHPQRKNTCKKRLFEPDDENACDKHSFQYTDRSKIMDVICFPPTGRIDVCNSESDNKVTKYSIVNEDGAREKCKGKLDLEKSTKTFWDWSPYIRYESLCTKVYSEKVEGNTQCIGQDPMIKIRKTLDELYIPSNRWMEINIREGREHCRLAAANKPQSSPSDNPYVSSFTGTENGTSDLELDQESSDSWMIKVGSWHSSNFRRVSSDNNDTPIQDPMKSKKRRVKKVKDVDAWRKPKKDDSQCITKKNRVCDENSLTDGVAQTINSVSLFLKTLRDNNPMNGRKSRNTFAAEVAAAAELCRVKEKSDKYLDEAYDSSTEANIKSRVRKNTKHIPTILRRSNGRSSLVKRINHNPQDTRRRDDKRVYACSDSKFTEYPRHGTGSSSSTIARVDDSDLVETPSIASRLFGAESENLTKFNSTRTKSKRLEESIERDVSCCGTTDVESSDDTSRPELLPVGEYVEKNQTRKARTRVAQSQVIGQRRVTFDVDDRPSHFQTPKPSKRSSDLLPALANYESLTPYHGDLRSASSRNFARQEDEVKIAPQESHARLAASVSEIDRPSLNRNFEAYNLPTFHDENLSSDRLINDSEYARPDPPEQRIRKPVVLFKPIQYIGNDRQSYQSCYKPLDNTFTTVSNAVRNLSVHSHTEDPRDPTQQQQSAPVHQNRYLEHQHQRYPEQALTRTICKNPVISINQNASQREIFDSQPAKFLALQQGDGDPQRIPMCAYVDCPRVVVAPVPVGHRQDSSGVVVFDDTNNGEFTCIKCLDAKNPMQQQLHHHCYHHQVDPACTHRSTILDCPSNSYVKMPSPSISPGTTNGDTGTVFGMGQQSQCQIPCAEHQPQLSLVACPSLCLQQQSFNKLAPSAASILRPTSNDVPRNGCNTLLASSQLKYTPQYNISTRFNKGFLVNSRVQRANGKIGTFIPDNCSAFGMGQQNRHDISRGAAQLSVVGSRSSPFFQQRASNSIPVATAPRNICSIVDCEQVASTQLKYKPQYSVANLNGSFNEYKSLPNRVQLADGTIGIFVPESRSVGNTVFFNDDRRTFNPIRTDKTGYGQNLYISGSQEICSSSVCRCNPVRHFRH